MRISLLVAAVVALASVLAQAQPSASPYAGLERREIKALGADELASLLSGHGMGMALAAELHHYPGPRHVLDLAHDLKLTEEQQGAVEAVLGRMKQEAVRLGQAVVEGEAALDRAFAAGTIDEAQLQALVRDIARLQGELRTVHLAAHLDVKRLLSPEQVRRYDESRGYTTPTGRDGAQGHEGAGHHRP